MSNDTALRRTRLTLVNADRSISLMLVKLRSMRAEELKSIDSAIKNLRIEEEFLTNNHAKKLIQEIQDLDIFDFSQDLVELVRHVENAENQLAYYIREMSKLV